MPRYDYQKLVEREMRQEFVESKARLQVICDIDKTYLETHFDTFFELIKVAFEKAEDKITVSGAAHLLGALRYYHRDFQLEGPAGLHFVSSSPKQLRYKIREKLTQDGLDWDSECLKNQSYNLRIGKISYLRKHIIYKTAAILQILEQKTKASEFILIGDNSESDPFIYFGLAAYVNGFMSEKNFRDYLNAADIEKTILDDFFSKLPALKNHKIKSICIRQLPNYKYPRHHEFDNYIYYFTNYLDLSFRLFYEKIIDAKGFSRTLLGLHNQQNFSVSDITKMLTHYSDSESLRREVEAFCECSVANHEQKTSILKAETKLATKGFNLSKLDFRKDYFELASRFT